LDEVRADHGLDQVVELAGGGIHRERGLDDGRAGLAGGHGLGAQAEDESGGGGEKGEASHRCSPGSRALHRVCTRSVESLCATRRACQGFYAMYAVRTMYTIKQAAARS